MSAYWPEHTARYAHVPLERVTQGSIHRHGQPDSPVREWPALVAGDRSLTYAELSRATRATAAALRERVEAGSRVALLIDDPVDAVVCLSACLEADLLAWVAGPAGGEAEILAFTPDLIVTDADRGAAGSVTVRPDDLADTLSTPPGRPNLNAPVLALPRPGGGEVLHSHRTLLATGIAVGSFFMLEPGASVVLAEPGLDWLSLAMLLGAWRYGATLYAGWERGATLPERTDYLVMQWDTAVERYLQGATVPHQIHARAGAILGVGGPFSVRQRWQLGRRLDTAVLTVVGRNDLGPVLASHPTWYLEGAGGIPLPNVDVRPLHPHDGRPLAIGWDAVEEAEMGVKSSLAPAGGELVEGWLRTRLLARVDPTGLYFLTQHRPALQG